VSAVANQAYAVNTTSQAAIVKLPKEPAVNDEVSIADYAGTFATNNCFIDPNGKKLQGHSGYMTLSTDHDSVKLTYIDVEQGWLITG